MVEYAHRVFRLFPGETPPESVVCFWLWYGLKGREAVTGCGVGIQGRWLGEAADNRAGVTSCTRMTDGARNHGMGAPSRAHGALCWLVALALPFHHQPHLFSLFLSRIPSLAAHAVVARIRFLSVKKTISMLYLACPRSHGIPVPEHHNVSTLSRLKSDLYYRRQHQ